jgi:hypothetical protein
MPESPAVSRAVRHPPTHAAGAALTVPALLCTALLLSGCGDGRVSAPQLSATAKPTGVLTIRYPSDGVTLQVPSNWTVTPEKSPMVAVYSSGSAIISLWRFPSRSGPITATPRLQKALAALVKATRARDPGLALERTGLSRVSGAGAVIIDAVEQVAGRLRRVRSEHVYVNRAELVLDAYAPPAQFPTVDHEVFSPVRESLTLLDGGRPASGVASTSTVTDPRPAGSTGPTSP